MEGLLDQGFGNLWVGLEVILELLTSDFLNDTVDFAIGELGLGLAFEARLWHFNRNNRSQTFTSIVAAEAWIFLFN